MFVVCWQVVHNCVVDLRPLGSETRVLFSPMSLFLISWGN